MLDCHNLRTLHHFLKSSVFSLFIIFFKNLPLKSLKKTFQCAQKTVSSFYSPLLFAITQRGKVFWKKTHPESGDNSHSLS